MPDRLPTTDAERRARRRAASAERAPEREVLALVERAASVCDGFRLLEQGQLECVAVLLGVDPRTVDRVRAALHDPALREEAALRFARAEGKRAPPAAAVPRPQPPRDADALFRAARARDGGMALLLHAAPECAAILFGVHPDLVLHVRQLAARTRSGGDASAT